MFAVRRDAPVRGSGSTGRPHTLVELSIYERAAEALACSTVTERSLYLLGMAAANASARGQRVAILTSPLHELTGFHLAVDCLASSCNGEWTCAIAELASVSAAPIVHRCYGRDATIRGGGHATSRGAKDACLHGR